MSRSRMDLATILVSTFTVPIPDCLRFKILGRLVTLRLFENNIKVEMASGEDDDDGSSRFSLNNDDVDSHSSKSRTSNSSNPSIFRKFDFANSPQNQIIQKIQETYQSQENPIDVASLR